MTLTQSVDLLVSACKLEDSCSRDWARAACDEDAARAWADYRHALNSRVRIQNNLKERLQLVESTHSHGCPITDIDAVLVHCYCGGHK